MLSALHAGERIRSRALFNASLMERVPESARQLLDGVRADSVLRHRILTGAYRSRGVGARAFGRAGGYVAARRFAPVLSVAMGLILVAVIGLQLYDFNAPPAAIDIPDNPALSMQSFSSGDLSTGSLKLAGGVPQYRPLLMRTSTGDPALLSVNGRYYQMLGAPSQLADDMLGQKHGDVQPLTADISLADRIGVLSNVVPVDEIVYAVGDYSTRTMVAAKVGGVMRVFQRIGYATKSLVGSETFRDTLDVSGRVTALELSGVGVITDGEQANRIFEMLVGEAVPWSGESIPEAGQSLTIHIDGGLSLQVGVSGDLVQACGSWACPEFFEAFAQTISAE
jgi:hypothetical protein